MTTIIGFGRSENFVKGAGGLVLPKLEIFQHTDKSIAWSGVGHIDIFNHINVNKLGHYYIDTGYFGNLKLKTYKTITKNNLNDCRNIVDRPNDRLKKLAVDRTPYLRGSKILIVPPDQKVLSCWNPELNAETWVSDTIQKIQNLTERQITVRHRVRSRTQRMVHDTFAQALRDDINVVVTYSSNCAVESILHSIPVISLGPTATTIVSPFDINQINDVPNLEQDLVYSWLKHLSYSQFTEQEMLSGLAWEYLKP